MLEGAGPGELVSAYPPGHVRELKLIGGGLPLVMTAVFIVLGLAFGDVVLLLVAAVFGALSIMVALSPLSLPRVHENGLVVHRFVLGDAFYPWSMFNHYWVGVDREAVEGQRTSYVLVLAVEETYSIGPPMENYEEAHHIIEENLVWRPRPRRG
jgi:hypothetical protein